MKTKLNKYKKYFFGKSKYDNTEHSKNSTYHTTTNTPFSISLSPKNTSYKDTKNISNIMNSSSSNSKLINNVYSSYNYKIQRVQSLNSFHKQCLLDKYFINKTNNTLSPLSTYSTTRNYYHHHHHHKTYSNISNTNYDQNSQSKCSYSFIPRHFISDTITYNCRIKKPHVPFSKGEFIQSYQNIRKSKLCLNIKQSTYKTVKETNDNLISKEEYAYSSLFKNYKILTEYITPITKEYIKHCITIKENEENILIQLRIRKDKLKRDLLNIKQKCNKFKKQLYKRILFRNILIMIKEKILSLPNEFNPNIILQQYDTTFQHKTNSHTIISPSFKRTSIKGVSSSRRKSISPPKQQQPRKQSINIYTNQPIIRCDHLYKYISTITPIFDNVDDFIFAVHQHEESILTSIKQYNSLQNDIRVLNDTLHNLRSKEINENIKKQHEEEYLMFILNDLIKKYKYKHKQLCILKENNKQTVKNFYLEHLYMYLKQTLLRFIDDDYVNNIPRNELKVFIRNINVDMNNINIDELKCVLLEMLSLIELNMNRLYIKVNQYKHNTKYSSLYKEIENDVCLKRRKLQIRKQHEVYDLKKKEMIEKVFSHKDKIYIKRVKKGNDGIGINYKIQQLNNNNNNKTNNNNNNNHSDRTHTCNNDMNNIEMLIKYFD